MTAPPIQRVPSDLALLFLRQAGHNLKPASLRNWTRRGFITRTAEGYDLVEITAYLERRAERKRPT
ncbi:hypothetical protein SUDANB95_05505 [Actinosynnema sp. ALI-1.44]